MKRGIEALNTGFLPLAKKAKVEKTLNTLLEEVNLGNYVDFREYLIQMNLTELNLIEKAKNLDLAHLSNALQGTHITDLILIYSEIDGAGLAKLNLQGTQVTYLNLAGNQIGAGVANLNLRDTQVTYLNLTSNQIGAGVASLNLQGTRVKCLILSLNQIGAGIANLSLQDTKVTDLYLESNHIGPDDIGNLHLLGTQVVRLGLWDNNISKGLADLHLQGTEVTNLDLSVNNIGPDNIKRLNLKDTKVTSLNLAENDIGDDGIANLHLQGTQVYHLNLKYNGISNTTNLNLQSTKVTRLDLDGNLIGNNSVRDINLKDTQVAYLNLKGNYIQNDGAQILAQKIPSTLLLEIELNDQHNVLKEALKINQQKLIGRPLSALRESYSDRRDSKPAKTLANLRAAGVPELQDLILSFVPGMAITTQYQDKKIPMGQLLQQLTKDETAKISTAKNKLSKIN